MRHKDGRHFGRDGSTWAAHARALVLARTDVRSWRRPAIAAAALICAALAWAVANASHAQAAHSRASGAASAAASSEGFVFEGTEAHEGSLFGNSVALSEDGSTAIVGGPNDNGRAGAVWLFARVNGGWEQQGAKITAEAEGAEPPCEELEGEPEACGFGRSVALSASGDVALIGSPRNNGYAGGAFVYTRTGSTWKQSARLSGGEEIGEGHLGRSVALSGDGSIALVGGVKDAAGHGAVWVFVHTSTGWTQQAKLLSPEAGESFFGVSIALSRDGTTAIVGGPGYSSYAGAAWIFKRSGETWSVDPTRLGGGTEEGFQGRFGWSVALSADGKAALVGARTDNSRAGSAWAFSEQGGTWTQDGRKLTGSGEEGPGTFGWSVALSGNGEEALVGAPADSKQLGSVWLFKRVGGTYEIARRFTGGEAPSRERLGAAVALSQAGTEALLGAPRSNGRTGAAVGLFGLPVQGPTVASIAPASGPEAGGTLVTIEGSGFLPGATVTIGSAATSVEVLTESKLTARTSASAPGKDEVVVSDERGTSSAGPSFTYEGPPKKEEPHNGEEPSSPPVQTQSAITSGPEQQVLAAVSTAPPPPVLGVSGNIAPVSGTVSVRLPGTSQFVPLTGLRNVPFGTVIDARHGRVTVTTMGPKGLQAMTFYEGEFVLAKGAKGRVIAVLFGGSFKICPTARERAHLARASAHHAARNHVVRKLWASGHGSYSTKGNYATGAVLGTVWLTVDRCNGTGIHVKTDRVLVTNLVTHHRVRVKAGHVYFAKAP